MMILQKLHFGLHTARRLLFSAAATGTELGAVDRIIIGILIVVVAAIIYALVSNRKQGGACFGCPYANACQKKPGENDCPSASGDNTSWDGPAREPDQREDGDNPS